MCVGGGGGGRHRGHHWKAGGGGGGGGGAYCAGPRGLPRIFEMMPLVMPTH